MARTRETIGEVVLKGAKNADGKLVTQRDQDLLVKECYGTSVPSATAGYAMGCTFFNTSTGHIYVNTGSITSCTFNDVGAISSSEIDANAITPIKMGTRTLVALTDAAATPTIAQLMTSSIFTMTPAAARTFTTPTATVMMAGIAGATIGSWFDFSIVNLSASTVNYGITLTAGADVTLVGNAAVYSGAGSFRAVVTAVTVPTISIYRLDDAVANSISGLTSSVAELNKLDGADWTVGESNIALHGVVRRWVPADGTLQALITSITDATATKQYTIMIPPGTISGTSVTAASPLLLKPFINLKGAGGRGRVTIFTSVGLSFLDAAMTTGTQRLRIQGIRFETCPLILTAASHTMSVVIEDCPINSASSIAFTGTSYASPSALEIRNMNIDRNTNAMYYKFAQVSFWNSTLLGLYFEDADAYFFGCDIGSGCNAVNAGTAGGWFEFNHCKIDQMTTGAENSESVLATFGVGGSENIQVYGAFVGETAPGSVAAFTRMRAGTQYFCHNTAKLLVKTADVGTNTWVVVGAQTA
jgi:hypothetical protein